MEEKNGESVGSGRQPIEDGPIHDLLIIGGGINGAGIARDAAGRGLSVVLCEQGDLAGATSSASTKLIHGGLRYLEHFAFRLVREALIEREVLLRLAPHIVRPLSFVLPHAESFRPAWMIRLGLFLYDHLGGRRKLPASRRLKLAGHAAGAPLAAPYRKAYVYSDCAVDDARLVLINALSAAELGARIVLRTRCTRAYREGAIWRARLQPAAGGPPQWVRARVLVNAAGPWVAQVLDQVLDVHRRQPVRLVKGSHFVVPRLFEGDFAYVFQNDDGRISFAIPYEQAYTLIGTTEVDFVGDPSDAAMDRGEMDYLCAALGRYLKHPPRPEQALWSFSGVRPLFDDAAEDASAISRDYVLDLDGADGQAPLLSVFGGKITTYRRLAEQVMEKLRPSLGFAAPPWTARAPLPGGDLEGADLAAFSHALITRYPWVPSGVMRRYARTYGSRVHMVLDGLGTLAGLGAEIGSGLFEAELRYLLDHEWARSADDILWRRTKLGLPLGAQGAARLDQWLARNRC